MAEDSGSDSISLFLAGDVMTGRGIDQILPHPGNPRIYEAYLKSAQDYLALAENRFGRLSLPLDYAYPWGEALAEVDRFAPDFRLINLETAVTARGEPWPGKGIHYRMHPRNLPCLEAARPDCCVLANNHVLDWGYPGLEDTLGTLASAGLHSVGAGTEEHAAARSALLEKNDKRVRLFAWGLASSGVPAEWAAGPMRPGVNFLADCSAASLQHVSDTIHQARQPGEQVVVSLHWGSNWGYGIAQDQRRFAHGLIEAAGVDVVYGHSSHHPRPIEVYRGKLILYGCGDLINDYEGITGYDSYRGELGLLYFLTLDRTGKLQQLEMRPLSRRRFRLNLSSAEEAAWLAQTLSAESARFGCAVELMPDHRLRLRWQKPSAAYLGA